jgi:alanyl-tRNA synthetase
MNSFDIRKKFLDYFKKNGHTAVPSSSLIPAEDPTLLFNNAGMNQFKDFFLGAKKPPYKCATSIQKCVRAGGKHNDLDQVGFTNRHLTFFEMMGNFSFGDYFKKEAIEFAWEFLTKIVNIPADDLHITIFKDDNESEEIWHKNIGIPKNRITKLGEKENFWQMGDTGPCGPCSEIHLDKGKNVGCKTKHCGPDCDCGRFIEIWNLVFMQYNRQANGDLIPLKQKGIDTGMGFERLCMILQNKTSVFEIDVFEVLIKKIEKITGINYAKSKKDIQTAFHVLCDHIRSSCLIMADGGTPSNEGRGYVLRKIIRRATLFAQKLSDDPTLFTKLAKEFINYMSQVYPELKTNEKLIIKLLDSEIQRFAENLIRGQKILVEYIKENKKAKKDFLSGQQIFKLYDTYGFPPEITRVIALENKLTLDMKNFEVEMLKQQKQSGQKQEKDTVVIDVPDTISTKFVGYEKLETKSKILFVKKEDKNVWIITENSPFYVESGGQVNDQGWISIKEISYPVIDLKKVGKTIAVKISTQENNTDNIKIGETAHCVVDALYRENTSKNHTATHLLQAALRQIIGKEVKQAGSFVNNKQLRFDFNYHEALNKKQIEEVETLVNQKIQENLPVKTYTTTLAEAKDVGVISFFGEKYDPHKVRVVEIKDFSSELCGGNHVKQIGDIGCFKIESEAALASGVRRIVAVSGPQSVKLFQQSHGIVKKLCELFKAKTDEIIDDVEKQQQLYLDALKIIKNIKKDLWKSQIPTWANQIGEINNIPFLFLELEDCNNNELKQICTKLETTKPGFYFLISKNMQNHSQINFLGFVSKKLKSPIDLKELAKLLKDKFDLKGGGSNLLIQGGGKAKTKIEKEIVDWLKNKK